MSDLSIIIAHRGDALGLWATITSCSSELIGSNISYDFHIVCNGQEEDMDLDRVIEFCEKDGKLGSYQYFSEALTPPVARQRATSKAQGRILAFLDNHCLVDRDYFRRAVADMAHFKMPMLHSVTRFYVGEFLHFHYRLLLSSNFWAESSLVPYDNVRPYRIAAGGHGGFFVDRVVWEEVGGYGPESLFDGYGGEEMYFDLKMALLDKANYIDPKVIHSHYAGRRPYARHYTDDYFRNMMTCALVIGGEHWLEKVYASFRDNSSKQCTGKSMYDLMMDAYDRGSAHAAELAQIRKRTLDEQLLLFRTDNILHS